MVQHVKSTILLNRMAVTGVSDMVKLVNEAFQCLGSFNLDQLFDLLYLRRRFLAVERALEKLPPSGDTSSELQAVVEWLDHLQCLSHRFLWRSWVKFGEVLIV